jgi:hypothetical protein
MESLVGGEAPVQGLIEMLSASYITKLNKEADEYTTYKVIYIARHGEGYHNVVSVLAENIMPCTAWLIAIGGVILRHSRLELLLVIAKH